MAATSHRRIIGAMHLLGVFAKYWQPGRVKTRLAAAIGSRRAADLQRLFLATLLRRLEPLPFRKRLVFTPPERRDRFAALAGHEWELAPQGEGDLGQRMRRFFAAAFEDGARRVVVLGSDSPSLPEQIVLDAFRHLSTRPAVLGPSSDGGYYLLGLACSAPPLPIFEDIPWGTPDTWRQTVLRLRTAGVEYAELPPWYDVDHLTDLERLHRELLARDLLDPPLAALLPAVSKIVRRCVKNDESAGFGRGATL